ncbi:single strand-specific [Stylonychia lemnae]|uniref:Single strand-specific n=1 Tax=Stylonychia lemnae TaxID=5949 RepID=A0A078ADB9_STYLE|nr:single strand-specific [Stylonychia lemnae]|eukprot:CDW80239.1 single strand-specific [Stylonychia lemnae]
MRIISRPDVLMLSFLSIISFASCFKGEVHLLIARIAFDKLSVDNPQSIEKAEQLLQTLTKSYPSLTEKEKNHPFVECATLADDIKYKGGSWQSDWHFTDIPWFEKDMQSTKDSNHQDISKSNPENLTAVVPLMVSWLSSNPQSPKSPQKHSDENFVREKILSKFHNDEQISRSFGLRLLIHYFGDIHQPLHCSSRYDKTHPNGDRGGNMFEVPYHYGSNDLHGVWDSVLYEFYESIKLPLADDSWKHLGDISQQLIQRQQIEDKDVKNLNVTQWTMESYKLAPRAYDGIIPDQKLDEKYIQENLKMLERQLVLAGLRLAHILDVIFKEQSREQLTLLQQMRDFVEQKDGPKHHTDEIKMISLNEMENLLIQ